MPFQLDKLSFWITNITNKAICLDDLNVRIQPGQHINLFDNKHRDLSKSQILKSEASGSLAKRGKEVIHRKVPPPKSEPIRHELSEIPIPTRARSAIVFEEIKFDELDISDDKYAEEAAELTDK